MPVEPSKSEDVILPALGAPITIRGIAVHTGQISHSHLQIHNPLKKWVQEHVEPSKSEEVKFQTAGVLRVFRVLQPN